MSVVHWSEQLEVVPNLGLAGLLGVLVGTERHLQSKSAGIRTHGLVALGAAAFVLVSKFGFDDLIGTESISIDPTRVAAQIVSGIGFLGAGLIFVRRETVQGLTTAASVWLSAAIGMAAGAGLFLLAIAATVLHYVIVRVVPHLSPGRQPKLYASTVHVDYPDRRGALRDILGTLTAGGWSVSDFDVRSGAAPLGTPGNVAVSLHIVGRGTREDLADRLGSVDKVLHVTLDADDEK